MFANPVLSSIRPVVEASRHVRINRSAIPKFSKLLLEHERKSSLSASLFDISKLDSEKAVAFVSLVDFSSFCYHKKPGRAKWTVGVGGKQYDGAAGLIASYGRALEEGWPLLDPRYLSIITKSEMSGILRGSTEIPFLDERRGILNKVGKIVVAKYGGSFGNLVSSAGGNAVRLMNVLVNDFRSMDDCAGYDGKTVYFYKKAQLLSSDIGEVSKQNGRSGLVRIAELTACADYQLPRILRENGVLSYSRELTEKVDLGAEIPSRSRMEVEIRANTIWAVELVKGMLSAKIRGVTSAEINNCIWIMAQEPHPGSLCHVTWTTAY